MPLLKDIVDLLPSVIRVNSLKHSNYTLVDIHTSVDENIQTSKSDELPTYEGLLLAWHVEQNEEGMRAHQDAKLVENLSSVVHGFGVWLLCDQENQIQGCHEHQEHLLEQWKICQEYETNTCEKPSE